MRKRMAGVASVALALALLLLVGCGGGDGATGPETSVDIAGTWALQTLTQSGVTLGPPIASGTLTLTRTNYTLNLTITMPGTPAQQVQDAGTYTVSGSQWTQNSTVMGQSVGTYSLSAGLLTVTVTSQGQTSASVWKKQ